MDRQTGGAERSTEPASAQSAARRTGAPTRAANESAAAIRRSVTEARSAPAAPEVERIEDLRQRFDAAVSRSTEVRRLIHELGDLTDLVTHGIVATPAD
jgi:hypothetical protein